MITLDPFCHAAQAVGSPRLAGNPSSARPICLGQACFSRSLFPACLTGTSSNSSRGNWHPGGLQRGCSLPFPEIGVSQEQEPCLSASIPLFHHNNLRTSGKHGHCLPFRTPVTMDLRPIPHSHGVAPLPMSFMQPTEFTCTVWGSNCSGLPLLSPDSAGP